MMRSRYLVAFDAAPAFGGSGEPTGSGDPNAVPTAVVSAQDPVIVVGTPAQLTTVAEAGSAALLCGRPITWSSAVSGIVSVSGARMITGVATGVPSAAAASGDKSKMTITILR